MSDLPAPLTPRDCSMAGNEWFPLAFRRLRKSKWWRRATDLARARNVMLWGEAYSSKPAGSLDDDDDELAEAAGFGMDVASFQAHKAEIMAPWTLCSDGRWYHPTVCEVVMETWDRLSHSREAAKKRKQRSRAQNRDKLDCAPEEVTRDIGQNGRDRGLQRARPTGQDRTEQDSTVATPSEQLPPRGREPGDWPGDDLGDWERKLVAVSNGWVDPIKEPGLTLSRGLIAQWRANGFSFSLDVLPVVQARCSRLKEPVRSWSFFNDPVREAYHRRMAAAVPVDLTKPPPPGDHRDNKLARKHANFDRSVAGAQLLAEHLGNTGGGRGGFD